MVMQFNSSCESRHHHHNSIIPIISYVSKNLYSHIKDLFSGCTSDHDPKAIFKRTGLFCEYMAQKRDIYEKSAFFPKGTLADCTLRRTACAQPHCCSPALFAVLVETLVSKDSTVRSGHPLTCRQSALGQGTQTLIDRCVKHHKKGSTTR